MNKPALFPVLILISFIVLVPLAHCRLFFDSYLIKFWIVQFGLTVICIYFYRHPLFQINLKILSLLAGYLSINLISWGLVQPPYKYPALLTMAAFVFYVLLCFFVSQYFIEDSIRNLAVSLWITTAVIVSACGIWQFMHNVRVIGTLGNENFLAAYIGASIPVCIGLMCANRKMLVFGAAALPLFLFALYLTHARGGWIGLSASLSCFAIIAYCPKGKRLMISVLLIMLLLALVFTPWGVRFVLTQFQGDVRPAIWEGTLGMIAQRPWLGWGKGAFFIFYPEYRIQDYWLTKSPTDLTVHAHNEFLQILAETGIIGLAVFLLLISIVIRFSIKEIDRIKGTQRYLLLGLTCGIIGLLAHNLVCNNLQMPSSAVFLWFTIGLVISYLPARRRIWPRRQGIFLALTFLTVIIIIQAGIRPLFAQYLFKKGWLYRDKEKWDQAINEYNKAISWYPWDIEMYYRTAYAYTRAGLNNKAIKKYKEIIRLAPHYGSVHKNMGIIYMKLEEDKLAVRSFLQVLRINEYDLVSKVNLSRIRERYDTK